MARLIDADKLLTKVVAVSNSIGKATWSAVSAIDIITAPNVDAVEVVRCKDCVTHDLCIVEDHLVSAGLENPFCCAGKRKDGDGNG